MENELARLRTENARLRARLSFLEEDARAAIRRQTAQPTVVNGIGQCYCPACHACVYEPQNIPPYWRQCQHIIKRPPEWCVECGQHLAPAPYIPQDYEDDPLKKIHKGDNNNGKRYYRR